jgi:hypothetical protein
LGVYTRADDFRGGLTIHDPSGELPTGRSGQRLYAHAARSLPPIDAIFRLGGEAVQQWLRALEWQLDWEYNENFSDRATVELYERHYQSQCPLYTNKAFAVLGGWHFPWPDGDWPELLNQPLALWTLKESEPWLEVWATASGYRVVQRIT